jgi:hypothetical protein
MTVRPSDEQPSFQQSPVPRQNASDRLPPDAGCKAQAVAKLLRHEVLRYTFGQQREYEVRTRPNTRQAWSYQCSVLCNGKEIKKEFRPIIIGHPRQRSPVDNADEASEAMRLSFATEAVDVHFARVAAVQEYLTMAAIYAPPPWSMYRRLYTILVSLVGAVLLTSYGVWRYSPRTDHTQPTADAAPSVQWEQNPVSYRHPAGLPFSLPLPALNGEASSEPVELNLEAGDQRPGWIHLRRDTRRITGIAPVVAEDRTYPLSVLAMTEDGGESRLQVHLTIAAYKASQPNGASSLIMPSVPKPAVVQSPPKPPKPAQKVSRPAPKSSKPAQKDRPRKSNR